MTVRVTDFRPDLRASNLPGMSGDRSVPTAPPVRRRGAAGRTAVDRGRAELARGRAELADGPVDDARETLLLAASLLGTDAPQEAEAARLAAADAAWAAGDLTACLKTLSEDTNAPTVTRPGISPPAPESLAPHGARTTDGHVRETLPQRPPGAEQGTAEVPGPLAQCLSGALEGTAEVPGHLAQRPSGALEGIPEVPGPLVQCLSGALEGTPEVPGPLAQCPPGAPQGNRKVPEPSAQCPPGAPQGTPEVPGPLARRPPGAAQGAPVAPEFMPRRPSGPPRSTPAVVGGAVTADYRLGMRALLERRLDDAVPLLRTVVERAQADGRPEHLLRSAAAALLLGDVVVARRAGARALAAARNRDSAALESRALEYLAYAELRAGRHAQARTHAEDGVRAARRAGRRNTAAHHQAMLALAASIVGETAAVAEHAAAALATARRHGLAQAATLAQWAVARADLGCGRPLDAADRLGPLVLPGPRRGHFAVWMLAVPCFVEAAVLAGRPDEARAVVDDFALWAAFGADPHAPAQLARCHALLAPADRADHVDGLYAHALALHGEPGGDFERARTELLHGKWLRRRRRLREARDRLGSALMAFERCGAQVWADQTRGELRAGGVAAREDAHTAGGLARLTPQQLRIARYVAEGATNREVALRLAVSTRTVDYHLRNVFAVLGVRSRIELARMVDQEGG